MSIQPTGPWAENPDDTCLVLDRYAFSAPSDDFMMEMNVYLHGMCTVFAIALHDIYGYPVSVMLDDEEGSKDAPDQHLIHAYCTANRDGAPVFIDVRGTTGDAKTFKDEFSDFFDTEPVVVDGFPVERLKEWVRNDIGETSGEYLAIAKDFIRTHPDWYAVPGTKPA